MRIEIDPDEWAARVRVPLTPQELRDAAIFACGAGNKDAYSHPTKDAAYRAGNIGKEKLEGRFTSSQRSFYVGTLGEFGLRRWITDHIPNVWVSPVSLEVKPSSGDGGKDLTVGWIDVQVYTSVSEYFARRVTHAYPAILYVFASYHEKEDPGAVYLVGWVHRRHIEQQRAVLSPRGDWLNKRFYPRDMLHMNQLVSELTTTAHRGGSHSTYAS